MKNIKLEKNLIGLAWWKSTTAIEVNGDPNAAELPKGLNQEEKEKIIQSWKSVAVLEIKQKESPFYIGFISGNYMAILKYPVETFEGKFGMRIGKKDVKFFAIDTNLEKEVQLNLIEITNEDNLKYQDLPLY